VTRTRWLALGVVAAAIAFAIEGGEYSTGNYLTLRRQTRAEADTVRMLQHTVDSLRAEARAVQHDPRVQERVARERLGMIGKGEFVYRVRPDNQP
jgi:cell division protein FtsB